MTNTASPSPLLVVTNHVHDRHDTGDHPESSPRLNAALHGLGLAGLGEAFHDMASRAATFEEIAAAQRLLPISTGWRRCAPEAVARWIRTRPWSKGRGIQRSTPLEQACSPSSRLAKVRRPPVSW